MYIYIYIYNYNNIFIFIYLQSVHMAIDISMDIKTMWDSKMDPSDSACNKYSGVGIVSESLCGIGSYSEYYDMFKNAWITNTRLTSIWSQTCWAAQNTLLSHWSKWQHLMHSLNVRTSSAREYDTQNKQHWVIFDQKLNDHELRKTTDK